MSLTFLDFFAGIGGFRRGMELAGHKCLGYCERDKYAKASYDAIHNIEDGEWYGKDINEVKPGDLPRANVWCFGFPCQDISVAGQQRGFKGERSSLFFTVTRLIRDTQEEDRPKYLFIENVKNLLSINRGYDFLKLLVELDEIGYDAEWQVLNSKDFGVPQNRERVFVIGHLRGRSGPKVFPIQGSNRKTTKRLIDGHQGYKVYSIDGASPCINTRGGELYAINVSRKDKPEYTNISNCLMARDYKGIGNQKMTAVAVLTPDRLKKRQNGRRFKEDGEPMFTLTAQDRHGVMINDCKIRRLTPKEYFRLQGWNDEDFEKASSVCSNSQLYKQAGNGVTVNVIYEIAKRLEP